MYSVVITTFNARFELFKSLFIKIKEQRPDSEVFVMINGLTKQPFDEDYRKSILEFLSPYENTFPMVFPEFISNSRMWNLGCTMATKDKVLILQDDLDIEDCFFDDFESVLLPEHEFWVINDSYSAFMIDKYTLDRLNWFDERFLGLGHEDGTWTQIYGGRPKAIIPSMINSLDVKFHDWQKEMLDNTGGQEGSATKGIKYQRLPGHTLDSSNRYSQFNTDIHQDIRSGNPVFGVESQKQYPYQKFYWDNKDKL